MLFYILLFAIQQTKYRQRAWFQSFMLWFMTEILITCSLVVWVLNYLMPIVIIGDIRKLERKMVSILHDSKRKQFDDITTDDSTFNAAEYLFVSKKIAKRLPTTPVAQMILSFQTPWPRQSYKKNSTGSSFTDGISYGFGNFLGMLAYGLGGFVQLPRGVQDGVVHVSSSVAGGYVVILHTQLFVMYPALAFVPLFCWWKVCPTCCLYNAQYVTYNRLLERSKPSVH
jgi:hypothetical protein